MTSYPQQKSSGAVVSDLHLFTDRTTVHVHMPEIRRTAEACGLFVFNGDIFDFHWSLHKGFARSVAAARRWIRELAATHADTHFVFILGNHDCVAAYRNALDGLQRQLANVEWHAEWFRYGDKVFLHGDVYHGGPTREKLAAYRARGNRTLTRSRFRHGVYGIFVRSGLAAVCPRLVRRRTSAQRIFDYLKAELGGELASVRHVYFGHVHTAFEDFGYRGIRFHNTGAATRGVHLRVIRFAL